MAYQKLQARRANAVTPSDTVNIPNPASTEYAQDGCAIFVGTGGNIRVLTVGGDDVIFANVADGQFLPVQVLRVFSTNTAASDIVALW
jgi:hypothetical protein